MTAGRTWLAQESGTRREVTARVHDETDVVGADQRRAWAPFTNRFIASGAPYMIVE